MAIAALVDLHAVTVAWPMETRVGDRVVDLDATLSLREVFEANRATKHDRTQERLRLRLGVPLTEWIRFESSTVATHGGPTMRANGGGLYSWNKVFQDLSPALEIDEAYVALNLASVDLRLGKQKVAWGKLDSTAPNDLINPLSYIDPFLDDEAQRKIAVPALQASYYLPEASWTPPESRLTAIWVWKYLPYRFPSAACDVQGATSRCDVERWFPPAAVPPASFSIPAGAVTLPNGNPAPATSLPLAYRVDSRKAPGWSPQDSAIGLRYSAFIRDVDVDLYYFHGFDPQPAFNLTAELVGTADAGSPLGVRDLSAATELSPRFVRIDSWGTAFAYAFDRITVRAEGAFVRGRAFARDLRHLVDDPRSLGGEISDALRALSQGDGRASVPLPQAAAVRDSIEWGIGADYLYDGYTALLQLQQTDVLHNDVDLLIQDVETRLVANLRKSFFADRLQAQGLATHAFESDYTLVRPTLSYRFTDHASAQVGYLFIAGRSASLIGQYRRNDQGFVRLEYRL